MAQPIIPISETGYLIRADSGCDIAEADRPLDTQLLRHQVAANLGHVWDSGAQHKGFAWPAANGSALHTFTGSNVANKSGNDAYTYFRTVVFPVRLCPDGRPEPVRVLVCGSRTSSDIWIRAVYHWAAQEAPTPWPVTGPALRDGWDVGQATFNSSTPSQKEIDSVVSATEQYGILQMTPEASRVPRSLRFEQEAATYPDESDYEPVVVPFAAVSFWGGFVSGTSGTGSFWGFLIRGCSYGLLDVDT